MGGRSMVGLEVGVMIVKRGRGSRVGYLGRLVKVAVG